MRGRILISAIAAVVIGGGTFWYWRSLEQRENSIEYHKAEYLAARDGRPLMNELREVWGKIIGRPYRQRIDGEKLTVHGEALLRLGYWREEIVVVSNRHASDVRRAATIKTARFPLAKEIAVVSVAESNKLVVRAVPHHIAIWVGHFREADVAEGGEPN